MEGIPLRRISTSLETMVRSIVSIMEPYASEAGIELKAELDAGLPATISIDEDKVAWALGTLIGNALRHVPRGSFFHPGGQIVVRATPRSETGTVVVAVTDDGPGIPPDKLPLLFQPAPYQRRLGYALILARQIAEAHGGTLEVESTQDPHTHGTTVRMTLPAR
jgi:two-component system sensor histidine kinase BaeS